MRASSHTLNHGETCYNKGDSPFPVTVIFSLRVLVPAFSKTYEQKFLDCTWKFQSSWSSDASSIWSNSSLSFVGRSKTKHFRLGKNFLIHSLGMLDFLIWGLLPVEKKKAIIGETVFRQKCRLSFPGITLTVNRKPFFI